MSFFLRLIRYVSRETQKTGLKQRLQDKAWEEAADFIRANWTRECEFFEDWWKIRNYALTRAPDQGLYLEFGVYSGKTINFFADKLNESLPDKKIYGFDNFTGLTESWSGFGLPEGFFDRKGVVPKVRDNVELIIGNIEDTLPEFIAGHDETVGFVHVDTDTYSPCKLILEQLKPYLRPGSIILFDQLLGYPGYQEHELAALTEIFDRNQYSFIAYGVAQEKGNLVKAAIRFRG